MERRGCSIYLFWGLDWRHIKTAMSHTRSVCRDLNTAFVPQLVWKRNRSIRWLVTPLMFHWGEIPEPCTAGCRQVDGNRPCFSRQCWQRWAPLSPVTSATSPALRRKMWDERGKKKKRRGAFLPGTVWHSGVVTHVLVLMCHVINVPQLTALHAN